MASNASDAKWSPDGTKIAFLRRESAGCTGFCIFHIWLMNADGTGQTQLTSGPQEFGSEWSYDGNKILFTRRENPTCSPACDQHPWVMNADGTGQTQLTTGPSDGFYGWSPDSTRVLVGKGSSLWTVRSDGTDEFLVESNASDASWSPDGSKIVFISNRRLGFDAYELYTIDPDGTDLNRITTVTRDTCDATSDRDYSPSWSPDGRKIVYLFLLDQYGCPEDPRPGAGIATINPDGSGNTVVVPQEAGDQLEGPPMWSPDGAHLFYDRVAETFVVDVTGGPERLVFINGPPSDWQPLPVNTPSSYARPKGASPSYISLVPAYTACTTAANRTHGAPLAQGSCAAPAQTSSNLTVGSPDANGKIANSLGFIQLITQLGTPGGPDDSDVALGTQVKSVYNASGLTDYAGSLEARLTIRLTDKQAGVSSTAVEFPLSYAVPCTATADPNTGSTCTLISSADALRPGLVPEGQRSIWALDQAQVYDGGADGDAGTSTDNQLFQVQGVFVP